MAYYYFANRSYSSRDQYLTDVVNLMVSAGWTLESSGATGAASAAPSAINTTAETITYTSHGFNEGDLVRYYTSGTVIGGLTNNATYFVLSPSADAFKLSTSYGGAAVNLSSSGNNTNVFTSAAYVLSSTGESGPRIREYAVLGTNTPSAINTSAAYSFGPLYGMSYSEGTVSGGSGFSGWAYADKDWAFLVTKNGSTYGYAGVGHVPKAGFTQVTALSASAASAASGTAVTLSMASASMFPASSYVYIVGANKEGRGRLYVISGDASSITVSGTWVMPAFATGALVGYRPSTMSSMNSVLNWYATLYGVLSASGNGDSAQYSKGGFLTQTHISPDGGVGKYVMQPISLGNSTWGYLGYFDKRLMLGPATVTWGDTYSIGQVLSSTASSGTSGTLVASSLSLTPNQYAGSAMVLLGGVGAGQIVKIISHDASAFTVSPEFVTAPSSNTTFLVCASAYRGIYSTSTTYTIMVQEGYNG